MKSLENLFTNSIPYSGQNYHYQSSRHDLSFISFKNNIYFVLSESNEKCLYGSINLKNNKLSFDLDKHSSWLSSNKVKDQKAIDMLYDIYNFMAPVVTRKNKP